MTNKYLSYDERRAPKVREMFSRLAGRYDLVNDVMSLGMHRRWKRDTIAIALQTPRRPQRWLDLCCGTGDMCFLAEEIGGAGIRVTGADFTLPMLAVGRRRLLEGHGGTAFVQADALDLPFADGTFDVVTVGYGLRNIADPQRALEEMRRVLAAGGRAVVLDFGKPDNRIAAAVYWGILRTVMPVMGWLFHGDRDTYAYIPDSLVRFPAQRGIADMMRKTGYAGVRWENRLLGTMGLNIGDAGPTERAPETKSPSRTSFSTGGSL